MKCWLLIPAVLLFACNQPKDLKIAYHTSEDFNEYWYKSQAELSHYKLTQARYGELREGDAVLIFVTEHLSPATLIKTDNADNKGIPVLKLNHTRNFKTGVYPYSVMTSVFTPVNFAENTRTLKVSFSAQEWCGQVFQMLKWKGSGYSGSLHSYFEGEGDEDISISPTLLEDEIFNKIRINPESLPVGDIELVPSMLFLRLMHEEFKAYSASAILKKENENQIYRLNYPELEREVVIYFEENFPFKILKWTESYPDGFGNNKSLLTTTATLDTTIMLDYWKRNSLADSIYRTQLGLGL